MKGKRKLLESLSTKLGNQLEVRRYNLSDMISESYKTLYECETGSNLYRLAESHLDDVRENPKDIDRLSKNLSLIKELNRMVESNELKDEDLVDKKKYDTVKPKKERALQERAYGAFVDDAGIMGEPGAVWSYDSLENYWDENRDSDPVLADYGTYEKWLMDTVGQMTPIDDVEESVHDEDVSEEDDENLLEDTELTDEEVEELTKHLEEIRKKGKKVSECDKSADEGCSVKKRVTEAEERIVQYGIDLAQIDDVNPQEISEEIRKLLTAAGYTVVGCMATDASWSKQEYGLEESVAECPECGQSPCVCESMKESEYYSPTKDEADQIVARIKKRYGNTVSEQDYFRVIASVTRNDDVSTDIIDSAMEKAGIKIKGFESKKVTESKSYTALDLSEFSKKSSSKAFVKTFKKLDSKLREGTALTRQESISLYKAANSAMTHLSVELEHNPEFLATFKESVSLLSADVNKLLGSLKEGKGPSKATMKSLAKFSEALLKESDDIEDEEEELVEEPEEETEGGVSEEEIEQMDQEYALAREELLNDMVAQHEESENPEVQEKLAQEAEEVLDLKIEAGLVDEDGNPIDTEGSTEEGEESEEGSEEEEDPDLNLGDDEITDEELAELKKHLTEMRRAKKVK